MDDGEPAENRMRQWTQAIIVKIEREFMKRSSLVDKAIGPIVTSEQAFITLLFWFPREKRLPSNATKKNIDKHG